MLIWRLRNSKGLMTILEELDALVDRKLLNDMYRTATPGNTRFWYVNLLNEQDQMLYKGFEHRFAIN